MMDDGLTFKQLKELNDSVKRVGLNFGVGKPLDFNMQKTYHIGSSILTTYPDGSIGIGTDVSKSDLAPPHHMIFKLKDIQ